MTTDGGDHTTSHGPDGNGNAGARLRSLLRSRLGVALVIGVALVGIGAATWAVTANRPGAVLAAPTPSTSPTPSVNPPIDITVRPSATPSSTSTPSPSPTPSKAPCVGCEAYDLGTGSTPAAFDDGIAPGDLPPLAARRGAYMPAAHAMKPWVWDDVGPGWGLAVFKNDPDAYHWSVPGVETATYLVSPEGAYFDLGITFNVSYGVSVTWARWDTHEAIFDVSDEGGSWREWVDLESGKVLREYDFAEEGGGVDYADRTLEGFVGGRAVREIVASPDTGNLLDHPIHLIVNSDGSTVTVTDPVPQGVMLSDSPLPVNYDDTLHSTALFGGGDQRRGGPGGTYHVWPLDVSTNTWSHVEIVMPQVGGTCTQPTDFDGTSAITTCRDRDDMFIGDYRVYLDGSPATILATRPENWWPLGLAESWSARGLSFDVTDAGHISDVYDTTGGTRTLVVHDAAADTVEGGVPTAPVEIAPGVFVIHTTDGVLGYDRAAGTTFWIIRPVFADTGVHNGMVSYAPFWGEASA